eukprot:m51a1_g10376 hypothetical protein (183) ;mRNA; r:3053-7093
MARPIVSQIEQWTKVNYHPLFMEHPEWRTIAVSPKLSKIFQTAVMTEPLQSAFTNANANANISELPLKPDLTDIELAAPDGPKATIDKGQQEQQPAPEINAGHVSLRTHLFWMLAFVVIQTAALANNMWFPDTSSPNSHFFVDAAARLRFIPKCLKAHRIVLKAPLYLWVISAICALIGMLF